MSNTNTCEQYRSFYFRSGGREVILAALLIATLYPAPLFGQVQGRVDDIKNSEIRAPYSASQRGPMSRELRGELRFIAGVPQRDFKQITGDLGYGASGSVRVPLREIPLQMGVDFGFLFFDGATREFGPDAEATVRYDTNVSMAHVIGRYYLHEGTYSPYIDGLVGVKYLFTDARVTRRVLPNLAPVTGADLNDWAFSYGAGAGLDVALFSEARRFWFNALLMSAGARYLFGTEADCIAEETGATGEVSTTQCGSTDLFIPQFGLTLQF